MSTPLTRAAMNCVRCWTWLYTSPLPLSSRCARRAEVESDLWEQDADTGHDSPLASLATSSHMLVRLLAGVPCDIEWFVDEAIATGTISRRSVAAGGRAAGAVLFLCALWAIDLDSGRDHAIVVFAPGLAAQSAENATARFEVSSVKPNPTGRAGPTRVQVLAGGRFVATNIPVRLLIGQTYRVSSYQLLGGPSWIQDEAFDVIATANRDLSPAGGRRPFDEAVKNLLAERFKLVVHNETRQLPAYALVFARNDRSLGPGISRSERTNCAAILVDVSRDQSRGGPPPPPPPGGQAPPCGAVNRNGMLALDSMTLVQLTNFLSAELNRKVFDRTGLTGLFNVQLTWTPDPLPAGPTPPVAPPIDPNGPSIFTAVQEQLGLKLESTTGPVDVLVIDRVERPAPN